MTRPAAIATAVLTLLVAAAAPAAKSASPARVDADYAYQGSIDLGAPGDWDYASFEAGRLYVAHGDRIEVVDAAARKVVGSVGPLNEAHGAAIDAAAGVGFATSGGDGKLVEFDLASLKTLKAIDVGQDADGVIFDASTRTILVAVGEAKTLVIVDAAAARVAHTVDLPGAPEFLAADGAGKVFVNLVSTAQLVRIDIASGRIEAVWPLVGCRRPHGLAYDARRRRLFSGCANAVMEVIDPASGKALASVPIGPRNDAVAIDEARGRVFSPNGDGTLTVIGEGAHDAYQVIRTLPTFLGARSMALDRRNGALFLTHGEAELKSAGRAGTLFDWSGAKVAVLTPNP